MSEPSEYHVPDELLRPDWLEKVERQLGRPLRVLNLGNIANNGFQNAKIMRRAGIDADCVAYDYYHVMGTAEWEDADFKGNIGDSFYPDWWRVRLLNYQRPKWFVQGPKDLCLEYLRSRYDADYQQEFNTDEETVWNNLSYETQVQNYRLSNLSRPTLNLFKWPGKVWQTFSFAKYALSVFVKNPDIMRAVFRKRTIKYWPIFKGIGALIALPFFVLSLIISFIWERLVKLAVLTTPEGRSNYAELRRAKRKIRIMAMKELLYPISYSVLGFAAATVRNITGKRFGELFGDSAANRIAQFAGIRSARATQITTNMSIEEIQKRRADRKRRRKESREADVDDTSALEMERRIEEEKILQFNKMGPAEAFYQAYLYYLELAYPDRPWILNHYSRFNEVEADELRRDIIVAKALSDEWEGIFELYDVVLTYSTDGILAMAGSNVPYYTYEHGTLRSIPFEDTTIGRLCATSYINCNQLMVTNLDNVDKPPKLGMIPDQVVYLPHAVDDRKLLGFRAAHKEIVPEDNDHPMILCPARHDWGDDDPSLMKGNDKLLRAVKIISDEGYSPKVILFKWGRHVEKSKELIKELGIDRLITWVPPMKKVDLWKNYFRCHAIVDQFSIPAFGGVTFEGLTFSKRIITSIDEKQSADFFGETPPVLNCSEPTEIADALRSVLDDPEDKNGLGVAAGKWAKKYHSSQRILDLQLDAFKEAVTGSIVYDEAGEFMERRVAIRKSKS